MDHDDKHGPDKLAQLISEKARLEQVQPQLERGLEAFQQSYSAYLKMTEQFQPAANVGAAASTIRLG